MKLEQSLVQLSPSLSYLFLDHYVLQKVYVQDLFTTASTEWARRAHSVLVRLACIHILEAKKVIFFKISP